MLGSREGGPRVVTSIFFSKQCAQKDQCVNNSLENDIYNLILILKKLIMIIHLKYIQNSFNFSKLVFQYYFISIPKIISLFLSFPLQPMASSYNTPYWRNAPTLTSKAFLPYTKIMVQCFRYVTYDAYCNILADSTTQMLNN